jgi:glycosyltransferase involved in cell wall biosynthesis
VGPVLLPVPSNNWGCPVLQHELRIALISTDFPPLKTSAAVQLRDLADAFRALGHNPTAVVPGELEGKSYELIEYSGVEVLRLAAPPTRRSSKLGRAIAECLLPFVMLRKLRLSPLRSRPWDVVVWYSPPIFFAPLVWTMRRKSRRCRTYLILRDIFPEWALHLGLLARGPAYYFFKGVALLQYSVSDVIGIQTDSNRDFLPNWLKRDRKRIETLHNWLAKTPIKACSINLEKTSLAGRTIFAYVGNLGIAQGVEFILETAAFLNGSQDVGFLFVGRGSEFGRLKEASLARGLDNVLFFDEIDPAEIPALLAQCHVGLVALHPAHKTHNVPGKFVSYVRYGLPVLARLNADSDLEQLILTSGVGEAYVGDSVAEFSRLVEKMAKDDFGRKRMSERGLDLGEHMFSPERAAQQILHSALDESD